MASTYTPLGIELQATGENAGTWGTKTNTNLEIFEQIAGGFTQQALTDGGTVALAPSDGATGAVISHRMIEFTGTITGNQIVTIPDGIEKTYTIINATTGAFTVEFKTASGSGFTFSTTDKGTRVCYSDGTNVIDVNALFTTINQFTLPTADGNNGDSLITDGSANLSFTNTFGKALAVQIIFG